MSTSLYVLIFLFSFRNMFSAVGKVLEYLWGEAENRSNKGKKEEEHLQSDTKTDNYPKTRQFDGHITHVFSSHGLIDNEVYFSFDDVIGNNKPSLGDNVDVVAVQAYNGGGWHASQVTLTQTWDNSDVDENNDYDIDNTNRPAEVVGKVTHFRDNKGYINDNIYLDLSECNHGDYIPAPGDWVKSVVTYNAVDKTEIHAEKVEALRVTETEGVITAFQGDHGYIDGEVFFTPEACRDSYYPKKWDPVSYKAVESMQGRCTWRAISIQPSEKPNTTRYIYSIYHIGYKTEFSPLQNDYK